MKPELDFILNWFTKKNWTPLDFQIQTWQAQLAGKSGLVHASTGTGKTYAAYLAALAKLAISPKKGLQILYLSPLKALSRDIEKALLAPIEDLDLPFRVEARTGDTSQAKRAKQKKNAPEILITTPESLAILLSNYESGQLLDQLDTVIVDEWHELLGSKRGTLTELCLARLRSQNSALKSWALSATVSNLKEAAKSAVGVGIIPEIIVGSQRKQTEIEVLMPDDLSLSPHYGLNLIEKLKTYLSPHSSHLVFTNTRHQAENWYQGLQAALPEFAGRIGLHHGSLDKKLREKVEQGLSSGEYKIVVATSSLDLGVDFAPVDHVYQIGSPKAVSRLLQRAGRSGHSPGKTSRLTFIPSHTFELLEITAAKRALKQGVIEARHPIRAPLDVLAQHLLTLACGGGFSPDAMFTEVRTTYAYQSLERKDFDWVLSFLTEGGATLKAYPEYHRIILRQGVYRIATPKLARLHRMNIGTIPSGALIELRSGRNQRLGSIDENYLSRLKPGDQFIFGGRALQFLRMRDLVAYVSVAKAKSVQIAQFSGSRLSLSDSLCEFIQILLDEFSTLDSSPGSDASQLSDLHALRPMLMLQARISAIPKLGETVVEFFESREGAHLFVYPFAGRAVHEGLASLIAYRMGKKTAGTFALSVNDYGLEILAQKDYPFALLWENELFSEANLTEDLKQSFNLGELSRRQFRDVAKISGLVVQNYPGRFKSARQLQSGSSLLFDVFKQYDPEHLLLKQAEAEALENYFDHDRLAKALTKLRTQRMKVVKLRHPSPFGVPLLYERLSSRISTETLTQRIQRIKEQWITA